MDAKIRSIEIPSERYCSITVKKLSSLAFLSLPNSKGHEDEPANFSTESPRNIDPTPRSPITSSGTLTQQIADIELVL